MQSQEKTANTTTNSSFSGGYSRSGLFFGASTLSKLGTQSTSSVISELKRLNLFTDRNDGVFIRSYSDAVKMSTLLKANKGQPSPSENEHKKPCETENSECLDVYAGTEETSAGGTPREASVNSSVLLSSRTLEGYETVTRGVPGCGSVCGTKVDFVRKRQHEEASSEKEEPPVKVLKGAPEQSPLPQNKEETKRVSPPVFRPKKMEKSGFSQSEHKSIFALLKSGAPIPPQIEQKISAEKERYFSHFFSEALENRACFCWVGPVATEAFERQLEHKRQYAFMFPRLYKKVLSSKLQDLCAPCASPRFNHKRKVFECGPCPEFVVHKTPYDLLRWKVAPKKSTPLLQNDAVIRTWVNRNSCDVVITASALTTMFNLWGFPNVAHEWSVPCLVKSSSDGMKTLYINKPFLKAHMTSREKNTYMFKKLFESSGTQNNNSSSSRAKRAEMKLQYSSLNPEFENGGAPACANSMRNISYELWDLGGVSVLVRSREIACKKSQGEGEPYCPVSAFAKLHYCTVNKRREVYCRGETANWWMRTALHSQEHSRALVVHVNPLTGSALEVTELELSQIPGKAPFVAEQALNFLKRVFTEMLRQEEGAYVMQCWMSGSREEQKFTVFKEESEAVSTGDGEFLDLHEFQRTAGSTTTDEVPYLPPVWVPKLNRIPETLPFEKELRAESVTKSKERFCYEYALKGTCSNPECHFPHKVVSDEEKKKLVLKKEEIYQEKRKEKKRERNKRKQKNKREREKAKRNMYDAQKVPDNAAGKHAEEKEEEEEEENFFDSCSSSSDEP